MGASVIADFKSCLCVRVIVWILLSGALLPPGGRLRESPFGADERSMRSPNYCRATRRSGLPGVMRRGGGGAAEAQPRPHPAAPRGNYSWNEGNGSEQQPVTPGKTENNEEELKLLGSIKIRL